MYHYLMVLKNGESYGLCAESPIRSIEQFKETMNLCVDLDIDYIIIDLQKAFDPFAKDAIIMISQSCIDHYGKEGVNKDTVS